MRARAILTGIAMSVAAAYAAWAEPAVRAHPAPNEPGCHLISARSGWQWVPSDISPVIVRIVVVGGWSVDAARFDKIGPWGHTGADAEALAPFAGFKYDPRFAFGALLMRFTNGKVVHLDEARTRVTKSAQTDRLEFRINDRDEALADNDGVMKICLER